MLDFPREQMPSFENKQCKTSLQLQQLQLSETTLTFVTSLFGSFVWNFATGLRASEVSKATDRLKVGEPRLTRIYVFPRIALAIGVLTSSIGVRVRGNGCYLSMLFGVYAGTITCFYK